MQTIVSLQTVEETIAIQQRICVVHSVCYVAFDLTVRGFFMLLKME